MSNQIPAAGGGTPTAFAPTDVRPSDWPRLDPTLLARAAALPGLTPTASDVMEGLGGASVVSADVLRRRTTPARIVGQAVTLRYLPKLRGGDDDGGSRLAHSVVFDQCAAGDVLVIDAAGIASASCFGGMAALEAVRHGIAGTIVDGAIRDVDQMEAIGFPIWARAVIPRTGRSRLEAAQINAPVTCADCQVASGDLVLADASGVCFIPLDAAEHALAKIISVASLEAEEHGG
jgi:4-hydroxy-4-methyl-2-oxoglutarate aldolase